MGGPEDTVELFECDSCGNVGIGRGEMTCCERSMQPIGTADSVVDQPTLDELLRTVFGMSETELDICLCVMEGGEQSVMELAERIDYDRSVVSRHLNHLVDLGVLEKQRRLLERGGHVYVYSPRSPDVIRHRFRREFLCWVQQASTLIDELTREKVESIVETGSPEPKWKIYRE